MIVLTHFRSLNSTMFMLSPQNPPTIVHDMFASHIDLHMYGFYILVRLLNISQNTDTEKDP